MNIAITGSLICVCYTFAVSPETYRNKNEKHWSQFRRSQRKWQKNELVEWARSSSGKFVNEKSSSDENIFHRAQRVTRESSEIRSNVSILFFRYCSLLCNTFWIKCINDAHKNWWHVLSECCRKISSENIQSSTEWTTKMQPKNILQNEKSKLHETRANNFYFFLLCFVVNTLNISNSLHYLCYAFHL